MAVREISKQTVNETQIRLFSSIQLGKVKASRAELYNLQLQGRFPNDPYIVSYVATVNAKNRYPRLKRFYAKMLESPRRWRSQFIHMRTDTGTGNTVVAEAALMAYNLVYQQTMRNYPGKYTTTRNRRYGPSNPGLTSYIHSFVNGKEVRTATSAYGALLKSTGEAQFEITNTAAYASTQEAFAYMAAKIGGIIYYAAKQVQKRYPQLAVLFYYADSADFGVTSHKMVLPVLTISSEQRVLGRLRGTRTPSWRESSWATPGVRIKKRRRVRNRIRRTNPALSNTTLTRTFDE